VLGYGNGGPLQSAPQVARRRRFMCAYAEEGTKDRESREVNERGRRKRVLGESGWRIGREKDSERDNLVEV